MQKSGKGCLRLEYRSSIIDSPASNVIWFRRPQPKEKLNTVMRMVDTMASIKERFGGFLSIRDMEQNCAGPGVKMNERGWPADLPPEGGD